MTSIELCAGAGGQALGLEQATFRHLALVEMDHDAAATLRLNRPEWNTIEDDMTSWDARRHEGIDLLAAGLPCPPFSVAGKQLGTRDERNLFPHALRIIEETSPRAVMIENVRGILDAVFDDFRNSFKQAVEGMGYKADWRLLNASDFGVPQLRPRVIFVALRPSYWQHFAWPAPRILQKVTVGETLLELISAGGWRKAKEWARNADEIAPTLVGGSRKHGGADLGPTRAKRAWAKLGVDAHGVADAPPTPDFEGKPRLTVQMCAVLQGFPSTWRFFGRKTSAYRQVGNAFPPPVAAAVSAEIAKALKARRPSRKDKTPSRKP